MGKLGQVLFGAIQPGFWDGLRIKSDDRLANGAHGLAFDLAHRLKNIGLVLDEKCLNKGNHIGLKFVDCGEWHRTHVKIGDLDGYLVFDTKAFDHIANDLFGFFWLFLHKIAPFVADSFYTDDLGQNLVVSLCGVS